MTPDRRHANVCAYRDRPSPRRLIVDKQLIVVNISYSQIPIIFQIICTHFQPYLQIELNYKRLQALQNYLYIYLRK